MIKVRISTKQVYYKYAQTIVYVPNTVAKEDILNYLNENEDIYIDKVDEDLDDACFEHGNGLDEYGMDDIYSDSEWRFDVLDADENSVFGGHL